MSDRIRIQFFFVLLLAVQLPSCTSNYPAAKPKQRSEKEQIGLKIDSLKLIAQSGDLIVRLGDDFLSYSIRFLSEKDPSFSHAGIIVEKNGEKRVCHIYPDEAGADTIRYDPLDSFVNPAKNLLCGLYRYNFSHNEKAAFVNELNSYEKEKVHFDRLYDLATDDRVYCSEMIAKSLKAATSDRITIEPSFLPKRMLPLMYSYFKNEKASDKEIAERKYIGIDHLYLLKDCAPIMKFALKPSS